MNNEEKILEILVQMQADIASLKSDVSGLKAGQMELKSDVARLQEDMDKVKSNVEYIWEDVGRISDRLNVQETAIKKIM